MSASLFTYFHLYRVVISALLIGMTFSKKHLVSDFRDLSAFQWFAVAYLLSSSLFLLMYRFRWRANHNQIFFSCFVDLCFLHDLFYVGEGITGGISNLIVISVAAANIMLRGSPAYALAAVASLLSLSLEFDRMSSGVSDVADVARAGLLGAIYFAAAFILQNLSRRISSSEQLAAKQEKNIVELQALNHQIIQSMRTGIIVCDAQFNIVLQNHACSDLIGIQNGDALPAQLVDRINLWRQTPSMRSTPFQVNLELPKVQANFSRMDDAEAPQILIFIEDTRLLTQQAQQLKLASLGRLTASIAHEVRNPLGAISHATQLLAESEELQPADRKMTDIIQRHCVRVNGIIENTLTLSRRAKPEAVELALKPWLENTLKQFEETPDTAGRVEFSSADDEALARFDSSQLEQVLTNLVRNGLRHGAKQSHDALHSPDQPVVEVRLSRKYETEQAVIEVMDRGAGVSPEDQKHLFEPFFTTDNAGTGLGLYISRELCEANQAHLVYVPRMDGGACFKIIFAHHKRIV